MVNLGVYLSAMQCIQVGMHMNQLTCLAGKFCLGDSSGGGIVHFVRTSNHAVRAITTECTRDREQKHSYT